MAQGITDPIQYSPLVLAYMGDACYELFITDDLCIDIEGTADVDDLLSMFG